MTDSYASCVRYKKPPPLTEVGEGGLIYKGAKKGQIILLYLTPVFIIAFKKTRK